MKIPVSVQASLQARGLYPGKLDGDVGPMTVRGLMAVAARVALASIPEVYAQGFWAGLVEAEATNRLRLLHAIAQATKETDFWRTMVEYGSTAYLSRYDGRADLGNNQPGDGARFKGRGPPMLTGRRNYAAYGPKVGHDLIATPSLAADPFIGGRIFAAFWIDHHMNALADRDDIIAVTRALNGGTNGLSDRTLCLGRLKAAWPESSRSPAPLQSAAPRGRTRRRSPGDPTMDDKTLSLEHQHKDEAHEAAAQALAAAAPTISIPDDVKAQLRQYVPVLVKTIFGLITVGITAGCKAIPFVGSLVSGIVIPLVNKLEPQAEAKVLELLD